MDFKSTTLWKKAFVDDRDDIPKEEQERIASIYCDMREKAKTLVAKIQRDMPDMTIHDVTHLDALWEMASIACGPDYEINTAEALIFGGGVLFHDAAMTLAAYPEGLSGLHSTAEWKDLYAQYRRQSVGGKSSDDDLKKMANEHALRVLHATQAEKLPTTAWSGPGNTEMFIIEDLDVRRFYGTKIGKIANSHWWDISKVETEFSKGLGALAGKISCRVDLLKVACLLRVADAMHIDSRRAPSFDFALTQPSGISRSHWEFQNRMSVPYAEGEALYYSAEPPFETSEADSWWLAFDTLEMIDRELNQVDRLLRDNNKVPLQVRRVHAIHSPVELSKVIETKGWNPVDSTIKVSDIPKIVSTLGGEKLYGKDLKAPIKEMIQNGLDAVNARRKLEGRDDKWGDLKISLEKRGEDYWLSSEDNGVGMSETVMTGALLDFGNSFWNSTASIQEFPGLSAAGMKSRGKYGIGFFSVFMLGDYVKVTSRRYDRDKASARVLEFKDGLSSRAILREGVPQNCLNDGGTLIEVKLSSSPYEESGFLFNRDLENSRCSLDEVVERLAPAVDVNMSVVSDTDSVRRIYANEWLTISDSDLLSRAARNDFFVRELLARSLAGLPDIKTINGENGEVYGRARITPLFGSRGVIVVDGLSSSEASYVDGVLCGIENTAARREASPLIPAPILARWATGQGVLIEGSGLNSSLKAACASLILWMGGDIDDLPLIFWNEKWLSSKEFSLEISKRESVIFINEVELEFDEGLDEDVSKSDFENDFDQINDLAIYRGGSARPGWVNGIEGVSSMSVEGCIEEMLKNLWGEVYKDIEDRTVGTVSGVEIERLVTVFSKSY